MRLRTLVLLLLATLASPAQQSEAVGVPELASADSSAGSRAIPLIPHGEGSRQGKVWLGNLGHALLIWGEVDGPPPDFANDKDQILARDHVEVWLAAAADIPIPAVGWGNQFDRIELPNGPASCPDWMKSQEIKTDTSEAQCREWAATQLRYRPLFKRLFTRQWLLTADSATESFATPAYERIVAEFAASQQQYPERVPTAIEPPPPKIQMRVDRAAGQPGYKFRIEIPYTDFPPLPALDLRDLWLMVDVFSPAPAGKKTGPFSTTSAARAWGQPGTFNHVQLDPPRVFRMTPCEAALTGTDKYGEKHPAWFIPQDKDAEADAFIVVNEASGYAYAPTGLSPIVRPIHRYWRNVGPGEWICGPELAYRKGAVSKQFAETIDEVGLDTKRLADGTLLIKSGPMVYYSEFGSGQCGACPRANMSIYALDKNLNLTAAFEFDAVVDDGEESLDFSISADWSAITQFNQKLKDDGTFGPWSSTRWCLEGAKYRECGHQQNVRPPDPPLLKELRSAEAE